jgi:uncharacterized protein (DUF1778 family)
MDEGRTEVIAVTVTPAEKRMISRAAKADGRTNSSYMRRVIIKKIRDAIRRKRS